MVEICVKCNLSYITKEVGVFVEELAEFGSYKLWAADLKECPNCHHQIVSGFSEQPVAEHYQKDYKDKLKKIRKEFLYRWKEGVKSKQPRQIAFEGKHPKKGGEE